MDSINLQIEEEERKKLANTLNSEIRGTDPIKLPPPRFIPGVPPACIQ